MLLQFSTVRAAEGPGVDRTAVQVLDPAALHTLHVLGTYGDPFLDRVDNRPQFLPRMPDPMFALAHTETASETGAFGLNTEAVGPPSPSTVRSALLQGGTNEELSVGKRLETGPEARPNDLETTTHVPIPRGVVLLSYDL